jgi:hypothetical protein
MATIGWRRAGADDLISAPTGLATNVVPEGEGLPMPARQSEQESRGKPRRSPTTFSVRVGTGTQLVRESQSGYVSHGVPDLLDYFPSTPGKGKSALGVCWARRSFASRATISGCAPDKSLLSSGSLASS